MLRRRLKSTKLILKRLNAELKSTKLIFKIVECRAKIHLSYAETPPKINKVNFLKERKQQ